MKFHDYEDFLNEDQTTKISAEDKLAFVHEIQHALLQKEIHYVLRSTPQQQKNGTVSITIKDLTIEMIAEELGLKGFKYNDLRGNHAGLSYSQVSDIIMRHDRGFTFYVRGAIRKDPGTSDLMKLDMSDILWSMRNFKEYLKKKVLRSYLSLFDVKNNDYVSRSPFPVQSAVYTYDKLFDKYPDLEKIDSSAYDQIREFRREDSQMALISYPFVVTALMTAIRENKEFSLYSSSGNASVSVKSKTGKIDLFISIETSVKLLTNGKPVRYFRFAALKNENSMSAFTWRNEKKSFSRKTMSEALGKDFASQVEEILSAASTRNLIPDFSEVIHAKRGKISGNDFNF